MGNASSTANCSRPRNHIAKASSDQNITVTTSFSVSSEPAHDAPSAPLPDLTSKPLPSLPPLQPIPTLSSKPLPSLPSLNFSNPLPPYPNAPPTPDSGAATDHNDIPTLHPPCHPISRNPSIHAQSDSDGGGVRVYFSGVEDFDHIAAIRADSNQAYPLNLMPLNQVAGGGGRAKEEKSRRSTAEVQKQMTCNTCADVPIAVVLGCRRGDRVCEDCGGPWRTGGFVEGDEGDEGDDGDDGDGESGSESSGISVHLLGEDGEVLGGVSGWYEEELASADDSGDSDYVPSESSRGPSIKDGFDFSLSDKDRLTSADDSGDSDFVPSLSSRCSSLESGFGLLLADEERVPFDLPSDDDSEDLDFVPSLRSRRSSRASGSTVSDTDEGSEVGSPSTMSARSLQDEPRSRTPEIPPRENESISTFDLGSALSSSSNPAAEGDSRRSYASCNSESEASNPFAGSRKASDSTAADSSAGSVGAGSMVRNGESGVSGGSVSWLDLEPGVSSGGTVGLEVAGVEGGSDWDWETTPSSSGSAARAGRELLRRRM